MPEAIATIQSEVPLIDPARPTARVAGPARILIIDDEAAIRDSIETLLTMEGFHVTMASDGA